VILHYAGEDPSRATLLVKIGYSHEDRSSAGPAFYLAVLSRSWTPVFQLFISQYREREEKRLDEMHRW
jgi:hypothetical protein